MMMLRPFSRLYGAAIAAKNARYDAHRLPVAQLRWPVVSVGNITSGGSGKTPFVVALIDELQRRGISCDVLSRGYGRSSSGVRVVDPGGSAEEFGDEPLLIAQRTGVPVIVGEDRYAAGLMAEAELQAGGAERIHLLDDGFQHRSLARNFDIVLLAPEDIKDHLLPEGRLREPLTSLLRADAIAVSQTIPLPAGLAHISQWRYRRTVEIPHEFERPLLFCGIARPQRFFDDVHHAGTNAAFSISFRDHHRYTQTDIRKLVALRTQHGADGFLTTEKDLARLGALAAQLAPCAAVRLSIQIEDADRAVNAIQAAGKPKLSTPRR